MHHGKAAQNHPVAYLHMASQLRVVSKNGVTTNLAVMRQMNVCHDPVVIAHTRHTHIAGRTNIESAKLTNGVAVANHQLAGFTGVFFVLRNRTERVELENAVVATNGGVAFNDAVRANRAARAYLDVRTNDGVRPNAGRAVNFGLKVNNCG